MKELLITFLFGALMVGCATPYQPKGPTGGYEEVEIEPGVFFLEYLGNGYTSLPKIVGYWHQRARELCSPKGMVPKILDRKGGREVRSVSEGTAVAKPYYSGHIKCESATTTQGTGDIEVTR